MKLVTVIPIARGVFKDTLTYWSGKEVAPGALVSVNIRGRPVNALVVSVEDASLSKANIKNAPFILKKVNSVKPDVFLPEFVEAAARAAKYFVSPIGSVLQTFTPKPVLDSAVSAPPAAKKKGNETRLKIEKLVFQSEEEDRMAAYRSLVREEFARKASVFICFPTIEDVRKAAGAFEKGIKEYTFVFHSGIAKKAAVNEWTKAVKEKHPVVILATASFLSIPRSDIKTVIIEKENSRGWKTIKRPEIDIRTFIEFYAEKRGMKLIFGDVFLRMETLYRYHERELLEFTSVKFRSLSPADGVVVDMKKYKKENQSSKIPVISNELKALIELNRRKKSHLVILAGRRGLSPVTICGDCGKMLSCERCGAPLVLHSQSAGGKEERFFLCHKCGYGRKVEKDGEEKCKNCSGWRLASLGTGVEKILEELRSEFPGLEVFRIDSDTAKNDKTAKKITADFYNTRGSVLVGTEMLLPYLSKPVELSALSGIDSYLTVYDFRVNEKIFSLVLTLRAKTTKAIILETQEPERELFGFALRGDLLSFYREEIAERKTFNYPPFSVLIKISWTTRTERLEKETTEISEQLSGYEIRAYYSPEAGKRGMIKSNILIKLPRGAWVDEKLLGVLKKLSIKYEVSIDPESIM